MIHLYTFDISHFSEKVRWALDYEGIDYTEKRLLPGFHFLTVRRMAPRTSVPVLDHDGHVVQGSSAILDYLHERLGASRLFSQETPPLRTKELETLSDHAFGHGIQRIFYSELVDDRRTLTDFWTQNGPTWKRALYTISFPLTSRALRRMYQIEPAATERAKDRFRRAFDTLDTTLSNSPYAHGDLPGRTDVTVAALLAPLFCPPEHAVRWPEWPPALNAFAREFAGRPTTQHVRKMYQAHRHR